MRFLHLCKAAARTAVHSPSVPRLLLLLFLASPSLPLQGQAAATSLRDAPAPGSGAEKAQDSSLQQNRPQQTNQPQNSSPSPQVEKSGQVLEVPQPGEIVGTVTDQNDEAVPGASVSLQGPALGDGQTVQANETGFFEVHNVKPGIPYHITISANGFAGWTSSVFILEPGQYKTLTCGKLSIEELKTSVTVSAENAFEVATEQVRVEEKQRAFGVIPNFFEVFDSNAAPLTTKLKFSLSFRVARDPATFAGVGFLSAIGQAANSPNYGQGAKGLSQRYGAIYANNFTDILIGGAVLPSLLHQDPRYFHQGAGSTKSRAFHAISNLFITKGDSGSRQPNYSSLGGDLASSAISNLYYPRVNRGVGLIFRNFAVLTTTHAGVRLLQEFLLHPSRESASAQTSP